MPRKAKAAPSAVAPLDPTTPIAHSVPPPPPIRSTAEVYDLPSDERSKTESSENKYQNDPTRKPKNIIPAWTRKRDRYLQRARFF